MPVIWQNQPLEEILEDAQKQVFALAETGNSEEYVPIKQVVLNALDVIERASKTKGTVTGIPTGFIDLDYKLVRSAALRPCTDRSPSFHG